MISNQDRLRFEGLKVQQGLMSTVYPIIYPTVPSVVLCFLYPHLGLPTIGFRKGTQEGHHHGKEQDTAWQELTCTSSKQIQLPTAREIRRICQSQALYRFTGDWLCKQVV